MENNFLEHTLRTVVLVFLPCVFAISYQCSNTLGEDLARLRQFFHNLSQYNNFSPIHIALTLIMRNGGRSFIGPTNTEGGEAGIDLASLRGNMIPDLEVELLSLRRLMREL